MFFTFLDRSERKLNELDSLDDGLRVLHTPNPSAAQRGGPSGQEFTWIYATSVEALYEDVQVTEFGAFSWDSVDERWRFGTIYDRPFNGQEFSEWYQCPGARIRKGAVVFDGSNYTGSDIMEAHRSLWYFIGITQGGRRVKGQAVIEHLAELLG